MTAKGPFVEFLRWRVEETGNNTLTEVEVATPASKGELMCMIIHFVDYWIEVPDKVAGTSETFFGIFDESGHDLVLKHKDPHCLLFRHLYIQGAQPELNDVRECDRVFYDPPLLYARDSIYMAIKGSANTSTKGSQGMIGYTLEKVSREDFIDALVS